MDRNKPSFFRCPTTNELVPHFIGKHPNEDDDERFVPVPCPVCGRTHMINRATGKVAGQED